MKQDNRIYKLIGEAVAWSFCIVCWLVLMKTNDDIFATLVCGSVIMWVTAYIRTRVINYNVSEEVLIHRFEESESCYKTYVLSICLSVFTVIIVFIEAYYTYDASYIDSVQRVYKTKYEECLEVAETQEVLADIAGSDLIVVPSSIYDLAFKSSLVGRIARTFYDVATVDLCLIKTDRTSEIVRLPEYCGNNACLSASVKYHNALADGDIEGMRMNTEWLLCSFEKGAKLMVMVYITIAANFMFFMFIVSTRVEYLKLKKEFKRANQRELGV